jgi:enediyne biosynthesis protein E4
MGKAFAGMGVATGDVDGDQLIDVFVTHLNTETHTLWKQGPRGLFTDKSAEAKVSAATIRATGFGTLMADFTNSGAVDVAAVNGRVYRGGPAKETNLGFWETYAEKNMLLANDGQGRFRDISASNPAFCGDWNVARGLACADYDNDGGIDLLVTTIGERARLFRNIAPNRGHWLQVRAIDSKAKRDAYGAGVRLKSASRQQLRWINPAVSYLSSSAPTAHFGLGKDAAYDSIAVTWPDGQIEQFPGGPADRQVEIRQGEGQKP